MDITAMEGQAKTEISSAEAWIFERQMPKIVSDETCVVVATRVSEVRKKLKEIEDKRKTITSPLDQAKKAVMSLFEPITHKLQAYDHSLRGMIIEYENAKEAERIEQQRIRDEAARKEREAIQKKADEMKAAGDTTSAALMNQVAQSVPAPIVEKVKTAGVAMATLYRTELENKLNFISWCMKEDGNGALVDPNRVNFLMVDISGLDKLAQQAKGQVKWPGIKINEIKSPRIR